MKKTRVDQKFAELKKQGKKGFVAYLSAGDPNLEDTVDIVLRLEDAGVDVVELGLPFSDPLADGRVNQEAATRALEAGATFDGVMNCISKIRERSDIPMIFYAYMNPLLARGFCGGRGSRPVRLATFPPPASTRPRSPTDQSPRQAVKPFPDAIFRYIGKS